VTHTIPSTCAYQITAYGGEGGYTSDGGSSCLDSSLLDSSTSGVALDSNVQTGNGEVILADFGTTTPAATPERCSFVVFGTGLIGLALAVRKR
jgi:hypothetical protein